VGRTGAGMNTDLADPRGDDAVAVLEKFQAAIAW
jgi:hypothetical protein